MSGIKKRGGETVGPGHYWNLVAGDHIQFDADGTLPGDGSNTYYRLPPILMLAVAPLLGLVYALFLPFIGIAMFVAVIGKKLAGGLIEGLWRAASFGWRPSEAYLLGRKKAQEKKEAKPEEKPVAREPPQDS